MVQAAAPGGKDEFEDWAQCEFRPMGARVRVRGPDRPINVSRAKTLATGS
jgi:hypothetical protein